MRKAMWETAGEAMQETAQEAMQETAQEAMQETAQKTMWENVQAYIKKKYRVSPEYPWARYDDNAVFRHADNKKWFALLMNVGREKLGLPGYGCVDALNLKIDDMMFRDILVQEAGIFPAYHMNKQHWITVLLDGTLDMDRVCGLIDLSFTATASRKKKEEIRPPREWLIPANPKYYDVESAFESEEIIEWKQSSSVKVGDTIFLYVAAPVSAVRFQCKAVEVDIPSSYRDENLTIKKMMKIRLLKKYEPDLFPLDRLREEYGIYSVRGPRGVPNSLSHALHGKGA